MGAVKSVFTGRRTPRRASMRDSTCVARSEWPPSAKKSSCTPTRSTCSTSLQIGRDRLLGGGARGHEGAVSTRGVGEGAAVDLAVGRERHRVQRHQRGRDQVRRQARGQVRAQLVQRRPRPAAT